MPAVGMLPSATSTSSREDLTGDGGVCKEIVRKAPDGALIPPHGSRVWVHYVGRLEDGTVFDSSRGRDQPLEFKLGVGQLISAYDIGAPHLLLLLHFLLGWLELRRLPQILVFFIEPRFL